MQAQSLMRARALARLRALSNPRRMASGAAADPLVTNTPTPARTHKPQARTETQERHIGTEAQMTEAQRHAE